MSSDKFNFNLADDTTLNATVELLVKTQLIYKSQSERSTKDM